MCSGILNILKPPGMTSHDVVYFVRKALGIKKVGHAGTLDPDAAGVLPTYIGKATRTIEYATDDKCYRAELFLGIQTDTGDMSGQIIGEKDVLSLSIDNINDVLKSFVGELYQKPPMYSAIKYNGKKLYELARQGKTVERKPRKIYIYRIELLYFYNNRILLEVECSKGTYIRTLLEDIAEALDTLGTMSFLLRTRVGIFEINTASLLEDISIDAFKYILPYDIAINHLPKIIIPSKQISKFCNGVSVILDTDITNICRVYDLNNNFLGVGISDRKTVKPHKVFTGI